MSANRVPADLLTRTTKLQGSFAHGSSKIEETKQGTTLTTTLWPTEQDAGRTVGAKPLDGSFNESGGDSGSAAWLLHGHIVDEPGCLTEFFPGSALQPGVNVADDDPCTFRNQNDDVFLAELGAKKPAVTLR